MQKIDHSLTKSYIEVDRGGQRLTHYPSEDTCLRDDYLYQARYHDAWMEKVVAFFKRHEDADIMINDRGEIIDNAKSLPFRGGVFAVGDVVLAKVDDGHEDWGPCARTIVAVERPEDANLGMEYAVYKLDDGGEFFWDDPNSAWIMPRSKSPDAKDRRVRKPFEGEEILTLDEKRQRSLALSV